MGECLITRRGNIITNDKENFISLLNVGEIERYGMLLEIIDVGRLEEDLSVYDFKLDYSGLIFNYSGRTVTRDTEEIAYCGYAWLNNWFVPVVIGATPTSVEYTMWGTKATAEGSFEADGKTIYYNTYSEGSYQSTNDSSGYNRYKIGSFPDYNNTDGRKKTAQLLYSVVKSAGYEI